MERCVISLSRVVAYMGRSECLDEIAVPVRTRDYIHFRIDQYIAIYDVHPWMQHFLRAVAVMQKP